MIDMIVNWGISQFTKNFMSGRGEGSSFWDKAMTAGTRTLTDKMFDKQDSGKSPRHSQVNLGVTQAKTYAMSDAKGPDTPEGADYANIEAKWTRIAKKIAEVQDTSSRV